MRRLLRRRALFDRRPARPPLALVAIALLLGAVSLQWDSVARVAYAQGGLVAAFSFDEGAGDTVADASGLGNHGLITGATWTTTAKYGKALSFNGTNQFITIADHPSLDLTSAFTLEGWVRPAIVTGGRTLLMKEMTGGASYSLYVNDTTRAKPTVWARINGSRSGVNTSARPSTGVWVHLAATFNGTTLRIYTNGVSSGSQSVAGVLDTSNLPLRIGGSAITGEFFRGEMDDVRIYNRSLTATEIKADMVAPVAYVDSIPPKVSFSTPASGLALSSAVAIAATASDNVSVGGVQFYLDGTPLGPETTTAPYGITWDTRTATNGAHVLTATAHDGAGNTASADISVSVNNAPRLVILQPPAGASIAGSTIDISYTTEGDLTEVNHVHFVLDGGSTRMDLSFDGVYAIGSVARGVHTLAGYLARADHSQIAGSDGTPVTFTNVVPDTIAPSVSIVLPAADVTVTGAVIIRADAVDDVGIAGVQFLLDGEVLGGDDTAAPYQMAWDSRTAGNGAHSISAQARDAAGNARVSSAISITVANAAPDATAPTVTIVDPAIDATVTGTVSIRADALDEAGVAGVQFLLDGLALNAEDIEAPYETTWDSASTANGAHTISARARDAAGNVGVSQPVNVAVANIVEPAPDTTPPTIVITVPAPNATLAGAVILRAAAADDVGVSGVRMLLDGLAIGSEDAEAPYEMAWDSTSTMNGAHTISARARDAAGNTTVSAPVNVNIANLDVTAPSVAITLPVANAMLSGIVSLRAAATDNIGVAGVQFLVDGVAAGVEDLAAPYDVSWDSNITANGAHTISARARDAAGNTNVSAAVNVTVTNTVVSVPATIGEWAPPISIPVIAIHQALLPSGKVLMWDAADFTTAPPILFDPAAGTYVNVGATATDLFCVGNAMLANGKLLLVGGDTRTTGLGVNDVNLFDSQTNTWSTPPKMAYRRWYPTAATMSDGRVFVLSGYDACYGASCRVGRPEIYNPVTNSWSSMAASANYVTPTYPFLFEMPDGRIISAGSYEGTIDTRVLDLATSTWSVLDSNPIDAGSAVMYAPGKIMKAGKWANSNPPFVAAHGNTYVIDLEQPAPKWRATSPMTHARAYNMLTLLPDGTTLATAGSQSTDPADAASGVLEAEIWSPATEKWTTMARMQNPRMYHGTSMLLPDGRVLVAGSGRYGSPEQFNAEIYSPPYLFKGARPVIASAPSLVAPGQSFNIATSDTNIAAVTMLRIGAMTHSFSSDQRFMSLSFTAGAGGVNAQVPANIHTMIPGYYLLFLVNAAGVPSVGAFVRVPAPTEDRVPPTAPANLVATGGLGQVSLTWTAATDNVAVTQYRVHRSTSPGFIPSDATLRSTTTATTFVDAAVGAGTYFYQITARDGAGNDSAPSNEATGIVTPDVSAPKVNITAPLAGSVSGTINVAATATDNVAVAGVRFMLDGAAIGAEDTTAPYSVSWNTATASVGNHQLTALARDGAGNTATSPGVSVTVATAPPPTGLVVALGFDEGAGTTSADSSGSANNAVLSNTTWTASGKFGSALTFDGATSWATVADTAALRLTNAMTLSAWVRPTTVTGNYHSVLLKERAPGLSYALYTTDGASRPPAGYINTGGADIAVVGATNLAANAWSHIAVTYNGTMMQLYVNGTLVSTTNQAGAIRTSTGPLRIGGNSVWGEYFAGTIDEVRVYNRALSAAEIQADMAVAINVKPAP